MLREQDVARLIKAAYDEASEAARAEFMARVQPMPTSAWPWSSAVQATVPRGGGGLGLIAAQKLVVAPAALIRSAARPSSATRTPATCCGAGSPEGAEWEPLHRAPEIRDTATIARWIGPRVDEPDWRIAGRRVGHEPRRLDLGAARRRSTQPVPVDPPAPLWRLPLVVASSAVAVVATGVAVYALARSGDVERLQDRINAAQRQEGER